MVKITILSVGKIKEDYLKNGIDEYQKRLSKYAKILFIEVPDEKIMKNQSEEEIKVIEGKRILSKIKDDQYVITLDLKGKQYDSLEFSKLLNDKINQGKGDIVFVIGGSLGLSSDVISRSNTLISLSKMTFLHQMTKLIILEQIYRAFKIENNETYHK